MLIHEYDHVTPMGKQYHTTVELDYDYKAQPYIRVVQGNALRPHAPDEIIINYAHWKELNTRIEQQLI